ncbi:T9SS type A sorting domain-containing protein [Runella sp.]|uniref:T9SS type A sorting domain-containing protein n=1 Tax=Runella sp. TaxID=1960881 RepID=UPI003D0FEF3B
MKKTAILVYLAWGIVTMVYAQKKKSYVWDSHFKSPDFIGQQVFFSMYYSTPVVLPDGKVIVTTNDRFDYVNGKPASGNTLRLNKDGSYDDTFTTSFLRIGFNAVFKAFPDGSVLGVLGKGFDNTLKIARFNHLALDTVYTTEFPYYVDNAAIQSDGKIILFNWMSGLFRLRSDGTPDSTFLFKKETGDTYEGDSYNRYSSIGPDDKIRIGFIQNNTINIRFYSKEGQLESKFILRQPDGSAFSTGNRAIRQISFFPDRKIFVKDRGANAYYIFSADGNLEKSSPFPAAVGEANEYSKNILLADGNFIELNTKIPYKIITATNEAQPLVKDSSLQPVYGRYDFTPLANGQFLLSNYATDLIWIDGSGNVLQRSTARLAQSNVNGIRALLKNDQILVDVQNDFNADLYRLHKDGSIDSTVVYESKKIKLPAQYTDGLFDTLRLYGGSSNIAFRYAKNKDVYALNDGSVLLNRETERNSIFEYFSGTYRIKSDGSIDNLFLRDSATTLPLPNNLFLVRQWKHYPTVYVARYIINNVGQKVNPQNAFQQFVLKDSFVSYWLLKDGKIIVLETVDNKHVFSRLLADGTPDASFSPTVLPNLDQSSGLKAVQNDNKILIAINYKKLTRLTTDGLPDLTFQSAIDPPYGNSSIIHLQTDQKILIFGRFGNDGQTKFVRLNTNGTLDSTFTIPKEIDPELISSIFPVSDREILLVYKGRIERLILNCAALEPKAIASKTAACLNESIKLSTDAVEEFQYQWQKDGKDITLDGATPSLTATESGIYKIVAKDTACGTLTSNALTVQFDPLPNATITPLMNYSPVSTMLQANTGQNLSYQWQKDAVDIKDAVDVNYEAKTSGYYAVKVSNGGCSKVSEAVYVNISLVLGVEKAGRENTVTISPNPNHGLFKLDLPQDLRNGKIELFDSMGRALPLSQHAEEFQTTNLSQGIYLLRVSKGLKTVTTKVVIN